MLEEEIRKLRRAATQRLTTAEFLFNQQISNLDAIYLAGYVVECSLKALILSRTPQHERAEMYEMIATGQKGYNFEFLKSILKDQGCIMPIDVLVMFRRVATWSTDLRYEVGRGDSEETKEFLLAVA